MKRTRKSLFLLLLSLTVIGAFSVMPISAHSPGDDSPNYTMRAIACEFDEDLDQTVVKAFPPKYVTSVSNSEHDKVTWHPELYRYDGDRFHKWKSFKTAPAYTKVSPNGVGHKKTANWIDTETHNNFDSVTFKNLPSGSFTVIHVLTWDSNGKKVRSVSPNWCYIQK